MIIVSGRQRGQLRPQHIDIVRLVPSPSLLVLLLLLWITTQGITSSKTTARMMHGIHRERLDFETPYLLLLFQLLLADHVL
eukprot:COSAG05_NODE_1308_length_5225_cov_3.554233_5_plen_81_part_00